MRENGEKVGLVKIRSFRPFPGKEIAKALKNCKAVAVMDRSESFSTNGGPVGAEQCRLCILKNVRHLLSTLCMVLVVEM